MKRIFTYLLMLTSQFLTAQEFSFQVFFEDAAGNKDTVEIGYDEAGHYGLDTTFGEADLKGTPYDSIFEVRAAAYNHELMVCENDGPEKILIESKKFIVQKNCPWRYHENVTSPAVLVKSKNFPVTASWDKSLFSSGSCHAESLVVNWMTRGWFDNCCCSDYIFVASLKDSSSYTFSHTDAIVIDGGDTLRMLFFPFYAMNVSVDENIQDKVLIKLHPNPTSTSFTLRLPENLQSESLRIISTTGVVLKTQKIKAGEKIVEVPTADLPTGIYFLQLCTEDGAVLAKRFVVAR